MVVAAAETGGYRPAKVRQAGMYVPSYTLFLVVLESTVVGERSCGVVVRIGCGIGLRGVE
jgi:hypothetical protein